MIFNSSKYSRINYSLYESEDDQFRGYEDIEKELRLHSFQFDPVTRIYNYT